MTTRDIDRRALVDRHAVVMHTIDACSPLSVGNGELCFTVDVTGLQTLPDHYPVVDRSAGPDGTLLCTQTQWAWHSSPGGERADLSAAMRRYHTPRGEVPYLDLTGSISDGAESGQPPGEEWLRANPHRLDVCRLGLVVSDTGAGAAAMRPPEAHDVVDIDQRLDLWTGTITSGFTLCGEGVQVITTCHPEHDRIGVRVSSEALASSRLGVRLAFPYGSQIWGNAADWSSTTAHRSRLRRRTGGFEVDRSLDDEGYLVSASVSTGAHVEQIGEHEVVVTTTDRVLDLVLQFTPSASTEDVGSFDDTASAAQHHWAGFWSGGGALELAGSTDLRAFELERRIVLSQYLTAINCAGSLPAQETGLSGNSWRGKFHLEMHWWHGAHFPLWGRPALLERSLTWYQQALSGAQETAKRQGCRGARWPKQVGPDGRDAPSHIGPFLIWQQPHPIYLAELVRRTSGTSAALKRYGWLVQETAQFMADFAARTARGYQLGPPLVPAQESYADERADMTNPTFELAYWVWALRTAQHWRRLLDLEPEPLWAEVADNLVEPGVRDGVYCAVDVPPYTRRTDHPSMLYALGFVPDTGFIDHATMRATLVGVLDDWDWASTWGWDYPAIAMTASRLGDPTTAVNALLMDVPKNGYLPNGHNRQTDALPLYLPGNGGLLAAAALMAAGWDGDDGSHAPGFPKGGGWQVRHEGLQRSP